MLVLSTEEKKQVKEWLCAAFQTASEFNGSRLAEKRLFEPLNLFDAFARAKGDGQSTDSIEREISELSYPDHPADMPVTVSGFLELAAGFYDRLVNSSEDILTALENGGAVIQRSDKVFVKTDDGSFKEPSIDDPRSYELRTQPRLAMLVAHLRNDGVNGQRLYMDDLVITPGTVSKSMMRVLPYIIVQIPRLDMEIAVCDQIGETTFVKQGTVGAVFWDSLSKEQLKARPDVKHVDCDSDQQWWREIEAFLSGNSDQGSENICARAWAKKPPNLDFGLIKMSLLAHRQATGEWLSGSKKGVDGKKGSYVLEHGPYAGKMSAGALDANLAIGCRSLPGGIRIADLNAEISAEHGLDYMNHLKQDDLDLNLIKKSLLAHRQATGDWLSNGKATPGGKIGSYVLEHGPYAGKMKVGALDSNLSKGQRGLPGNMTIASLNAEVSAEYGLDYINIFEQDDFDLEAIKTSLLAHRQATGEWLTNGKAAPGGKIGSYVLEHGPYAGQITVSTLQSCLSSGYRGLPGGTTIASLNAEVSAEHGLDYINIFEQDDLDLEAIKASLLAHRQATEKWLSSGKKGSDGLRGSYVLEHGPYAGQMTVGALEGSLSVGRRGLPGGITIASLNAQVSAEHGLDYVNKFEQDDLDLELIKMSLLSHRRATGEWLSVSKKGADGKARSYVLEHGPYAGQMTVGALEANLAIGCRGLSGSMRIAGLNAEISTEHNLDYVNHLEQDDLDLELIKMSLLAHYEATGEWLSCKKESADGKAGGYVLEHGPYAGQITIGALDTNLSKGNRGLMGGITVAILNRQLRTELKQSQDRSNPTNDM